MLQSISFICITYSIIIKGQLLSHHAYVEQKITQTTNASTMQDRSAMQEDPNRYSRVLYHLSYVPSQIVSEAGRLMCTPGWTLHRYNDAGTAHACRLAAVVVAKTT